MSQPPRPKGKPGPAVDPRKPLPAARTTQQTPPARGVAQLKPAAPPRVPNAPAAPPVYRPQPTPAVLQRKARPGNPQLSEPPSPARPRSAAPAAPPRAQQPAAAAPKPATPNARPAAAIQRTQAAAQTPRPAGSQHIQLKAPAGARPSPSGGGRGGGVIQRVKADLYAGTVGMSHIADASDAVGGGVTGYAAHAERKAWAAGKESVKAAMEKNLTQQMDVQIDVDKGICHHCQMWLENTLLPTLHQWDAQLNRTLPTRLYVEVKLRGKTAVRQQIVKGTTNWTGMSYTAQSIRDLSKAELKVVKASLYT